MAAVDVVPWATVGDLPSSAVSMWAPAQWGGFLDTATAILWGLTGRRWRGFSREAEARLPADPVTWPSGCCPCQTGRAGRCARPRKIRLPHPDVTAVDSVTVDGTAFADWRLSGSWLVRTDGRGWALCRVPTVITYGYGLDPPPAGKMACIDLAVELARDACPDPDQPCRLPQRLRSVARQGLTFEQAPELDRFEFLDKGLTGIYSVDAWLSAVNPHRRSQAARVWSPDLIRARRTG